VGNELMAASQAFSRVKDWQNEVRLITSGIDFLRLAIEASPRERTTLTLAALYGERGLTHRAAANGQAEALQYKCFSSAIDDFEAALKLRPNDAELKSRAADTYNSRGCSKQNRLSVSDFTRAIELDPTNPLYKANRGISHLEADSLDSALEDLSEACRIQRRPEWVKFAALAFNRKGLGAWKEYQSYAYSWKKREALDCFKAATDLEPNDSTYRNNYQIASRG
jgi:tetratricopeptide (TPR) repeat protein